MLTDEHVHLIGRAFGLDDDFLGALCRRLPWLKRAGLALRYGFMLSAVLFALRAVGAIEVPGWICPVPFAAGFLGGLALVFATVAAIGREERNR